MEQGPLCPGCGVPLLDAGDLPTFTTEEVATGEKKLPWVWMISCGNCRRLIAVLPPGPARPKRRS
jgi:hypothetical protein